MKASHIIFAVLFFPIFASAQIHSDAIEAAKLGMVEKVYAGGGDHFRTLLTSRDLSAEEVENLLFEAIDAYALCLVLAAKEQALEQGLSEEVILKGIGTRTRGKEESLILLSLDMDALKLKRAPCKIALSKKLGTTIM